MGLNPLGIAVSAGYHSDTLDVPAPRTGDPGPAVRTSSRLRCSAPVLHFPS